MVSCHTDIQNDPTITTWLFFLSKPEQQKHLDIYTSIHLKLTQLTMNNKQLLAL